MANIPAKSDGDIYYAANIFKIISSDNTGGSAATDADNVVSTLSLSANQASAGVLIIAGVRYYVNGIATGTATFKIKSDNPSATLKTLQMTNGNSGAANSSQSGTVIAFVDTVSTFTGAINYTITAGEDSSGTAYVDWAIAIGV